MRGKEEIKKTIEDGKAVLGIEFGSTRIKAVLIDEDKSPIASGSYDWENQLVDNVWTYSMEKIQNGLQGCYQDLVKDVEAKYDVKLTKFAALGVSAMMHGYLAFDENDELLVPFRTWRNTITEEASEKLTELFSYHIPQRWSIAHLYQAILNGEEHVKDITFFTTLAGYIHWKLTGEKVAHEGAFTPGNGWQEVRFDAPVKGRFFCLEALSPQANNNIAAIAEFDVLGADGKPVSREHWKIRYADSEETRSGNRTADKIFDLQESTFWMTVDNVPYPHQLVIDLSKVENVTGFRYLPRAEKGYPGMIKEYRVYVKPADFNY